MDATLYTEVARLGAAASDAGVLDWLRTLKVTAAVLPASLRLGVLMLLLTLMLRIGFREPRA